jgi:hypothetical protein
VLPPLPELPPVLPCWLIVTRYDSPSIIIVIVFILAELDVFSERLRLI